MSNWFGLLVGSVVAVLRLPLLLPVPTFATDGELAPPHAASPMAAAATKTATPPNRERF